MPKSLIQVWITLMSDSSLNLTYILRYTKIRAILKFQISFKTEHKYTVSWICFFPPLSLLLLTLDSDFNLKDILGLTEVWSFAKKVLIKSQPFTSIS